MKNSISKVFGFQSIILLTLVLPMVASATTAVVEVDTGTEDINALEGTLVLPEGMSVNEIQTGNSAILVWISSPKQVGNAITFAGITPGGFMGTYPVFTISGEFDAQDLERVRFEPINALKNDGSGMSVPVRIPLSPVELKSDTEPPEDFTPVVTSDPNVFDGKYFLVFATQDKSSGIDRYEVREGRWGWFREVESPYLLKNQQLDRDVYVKATDSAGNERVAVLAARVHKSWWKGYENWLIIILGFSIVYVLIRLQSKIKMQKSK